MNENELMSSLPVPKAVAKMAIPSVISSLVTVWNGRQCGCIHGDGREK